YPEKEAPTLDEGTSIGVMARRDLRLTSIEDCILLCAQKNFVAAAHKGDMRLDAHKAVSVKGASVTVTGGYVSIGSGGKGVVKAGDDLTISCAGNLGAAAAGDVTVEGGGTATIRGGSVVIEGGSITLNGPVTVNGDLTVNGAINGG